MIMVVMKVMVVVMIEVMVMMVVMKAMMVVMHLTLGWRLTLDCVYEPLSPCCLGVTFSPPSWCPPAVGFPQGLEVTQPNPLIICDGWWVSV